MRGIFTQKSCTSSDTQKHRLQALTCNRCIFMQWRIESLVRCGYRPGAVSFPAVCRLVGCPAPAGADGCTGSFDRRSRMQRILAFSARMPAGWSERLRRNSPPWERSRLCCKRWRRFGLNRGKWLLVTSLEKRSEIPFIFFPFLKINPTHPTLYENVPKFRHFLHFFESPTLHPHRSHTSHTFSHALQRIKKCGRIGEKQISFLPHEKTCVFLAVFSILQRKRGRVWERVGNGF